MNITKYYTKCHPPPSSLHPLGSPPGQKVQLMGGVQLRGGRSVWEIGPVRCRKVPVGAGKHPKQNIWAIWLGRNQPWMVLDHFFSLKASTGDWTAHDGIFLKLRKVVAGMQSVHVTADKKKPYCILCFKCLCSQGCIKKVFF